MQLSTKARYATRALVKLAAKYNEGPVKLKDIAESQEISLKYLEQVMFPLRVAGFVRTQKGSQGGYTLAREPQSISLLDIVECVEGSIAPVDCTDNPEICDRIDTCATREAWVDLQKVIKKELGRFSLADLAERQKIMDESVS